LDYNSDFKYDLKTGVIGEKYLGRILSDKKIEVKTDFIASKTGNIFIEYMSRGKPSGISTTHADWYAFVLSNDLIFLISSEKLKEKCRKYLKTKRDVVGGDNNSSKGIILPLIELGSIK
jgi:hypothetical protein